MLADNYELIEGIAFNLGIVALFALIGFAIHDVLKRNDVPMVGRIVVYGVLGLGAMGFVAKGIIQIIWQTSGVSG